jgi:hypothetical protein
MSTPAEHILSPVPFHLTCSPMKQALLAAFLLTGCATSFTGDAHFPGGPGGCEARCQSDQMVMEAFVYLGSTPAVASAVGLTRRRRQRPQSPVAPPWRAS